jgi:hypothetical protein
LRNATLKTPKKEKPPMSTDTQADDVVAGKKRRGPQPRRRIELPDGDWLEPRSEFAAAIRITPRTLRRVPGFDEVVTYLGGVGYVRHNAALEVIAARRFHPHYNRNLPARRRKRR